MGKWKYRKLGPSGVQEICVVCEVKPQKRKRNKYLPYCSSCEGKLFPRKRNRTKYIRGRNRPYTKYKKDSCEKCGFIPVDLCQLDVDHIDGNHRNNSVDNLQTLCANCHRLKTYLNKDWEPR